MSEYARQIKKLIDEEILESEFEVTKEEFFTNLKKSVEEKDYEAFDTLIYYFMNYGFDHKELKEQKYSRKITQYLYEMILNEKYDFMKAWKALEFITIVNPIILERIETTFNDARLGILTEEDKAQLKESFLITTNEFNIFTLNGMLLDEYESYSSLKDKIENFIYYSLFSLELMVDALVNLKGTGRDYLPNRKYTEEMFDYAATLYNDTNKRLKQDEVILDTLKKYNLPIEKIESFKVRWGIHKKNKIKKRKQPFIV